MALHDRKVLVNFRPDYDGYPYERIVNMCVEPIDCVLCDHPCHGNLSMTNNRISDAGGA